MVKRASLGSYSVLVVLMLGGYLGCESEQEPTRQEVTVAATGTGMMGQSSPCNFGRPDGFCVPVGPAAETCECADCAGASICTGSCNENGSCERGDNGNEDCTCSDCFAECGPQGECDDDESNACGSGENCTCPDCTNTDFCTNNCIDDGVCIEYYEGCACADCPCSGGNPATTSGPATSPAATSGGGAGGAGGSTGN
ncbi:MAG: hypothetical protein AAGA56_21680 [Myxococcota bacterium]